MSRRMRFLCGRSLRDKFGARQQELNAVVVVVVLVVVVVIIIYLFIY